MILPKILLLFAITWTASYGAKISIIPSGLGVPPILDSVLGTISNVSTGAVDAVVGVVDDTGKAVFAITDKIVDLLEKFRDKMVSEITELGLPRLEPLEIKHVDIDVDHEIGIIKGSLDDLKIEKLSKFHIAGVKLNVLQFRVILNLTFNELDISGKYNIDGEIGEMIHVYGSGPFTATIHDVDTGVDVKLKYSGSTKRFYIDSIHVTFKFQNMTCNFENLMGGGENGVLFNKVLSQLAPEAVEFLWPEIEPEISKRLKEEGTAILANVDVKDILELFK